MAHRALSRDLRELEKWIDFNTGWSKAREEFLPMARGREAASCKVLSTCFEELVQQAALFSPAIAKLLERVWVRVVDVVRSVLSRQQRDLAHINDLRSNLAAARREHRDYVSGQSQREEELQRQNRALRAELLTVRADLGSAERELAIAGQENSRLRALVEDEDGGHEGLDLEGEGKSRGPEEAVNEFKEVVRQISQENMRQMNLLSTITQITNGMHLGAMALTRTGDTVKREHRTTQTDAMPSTESGPNDNDLPPPAPPLSRDRGGAIMPPACRDVMSSLPPGGRIMSIRAVKKRALEIFLAKVAMDKASDEGSASPSAAKVAYEFLFHQYGLRELTDWHMVALVSTLRKHASESGRLQLLGRLLGCDLPEAGGSALPPQAFDFVGQVLGAMVDKGQVQSVVQDADQAVYISTKVVVPILRAALKPIADPGSVDEVVKQVQEAAAQTTPPMAQARQGRDLDLDTFMQLAVTAWERADAAWSSTLKAAFYGHARLVRVDEEGITTMSVEGVEASPDADDPDQGYRCILEVPSTCETALKAVDALSPKEVQALAGAAATLFYKERQEEFFAMWPSHQWGRDGRKFYFNKETRERRWSRPEFDPSPTEVGVAAFINVCKSSNVGCPGEVKRQIQVDLLDDVGPLQGGRADGEEAKGEVGWEAKGDGKESQTKGADMSVSPGPLPAPGLSRRGSRTGGDVSDEGALTRMRMARKHAEQAAEPVEGE